MVKNEKVKSNFQILNGHSKRGTVEGTQKEMEWKS